MTKPRHILRLPFRQVQCGCCGWFLAARSVQQLFSFGWRCMINTRWKFEPKKPRRAKPDWEMKLSFICDSCSQSNALRIFVCRPGSTLLVKEAFETTPLAPPDAYPRIGGKGEKHRDKSRHEKCKNCGGLAHYTETGRRSHHAPVAREDLQ